MYILTYANCGKMQIIIATRLDSQQHTSWPADSVQQLSASLAFLELENIAVRNFAIAKQRNYIKAPGQYGICSNNYSNNVEKNMQEMQSEKK